MTCPGTSRLGMPTDSEAADGEEGGSGGKPEPEPEKEPIGV